MTMTTINVEMMVRRKQGILIPEAQGTPATDVVFGSFLRSLEQLGYTLGERAFSAARSLSTEQLVKFHDTFLPELGKQVGAHVQYKPMYPNFPNQVMQASDAELYLNAFMRYFGDAIGVLITPVTKVGVRAALNRRFSHLKVLDLITEEDFIQIFSDLLSMKASFSPVDVEDLKWFIENYGDEALTRVPEVIPNKENIAHFVVAVHHYDKSLAESFIKNHAKTATDLLRIAVSLSGNAGSVSLAAYPPIRFGNISKADRRFLLNALNHVPYPQEDMARYAGLWKILGEKLHPGQYATRYPKAYEAFSDLRSGKPAKSFAAKFDALMAEGDIVGVTKLAVTRPGEFARRLDYMLRSSTVEDHAGILASFAAVAPQVATNVLWKVRSHFEKRDEKKENRYFYLKGDLARIKSIPNEVPVMDAKLASQVVEICSNALVESLSERTAMGKVYINPKLRSYTLPEAVRSANRSLNMVGRGTRIPLGDDKIQRLFLWWKDGERRTDLDLSANFYDENFNTMDSVWYGNLRNSYATHSGDITSAPHGASEFIDVNVPVAVQHGVRYVTMSVISFSGQPLHLLPECFAGVMSRPDGQSGEIYDPRTVRNTFDLSAESTLIVSMVIDLLKREYIWADVSATHPGAYANVSTDAPLLAKLSQSIVEKEYVTLYDVFGLNALGRGELVDSPEDADIVFDVDASGRVSESAESILGNYV